MALAFLAKLILWSSCSFTIMWPLYLHIHLQHESTIIPAKPKKRIYLCSLLLLSCWHPFDLLALPSNSAPQLSMHQIVTPFYHHIPHTHEHITTRWIGHICNGPWDINFSMLPVPAVRTFSTTSFSYMFLADFVFK
jgi:hypothetical protein